MFLCALYIFNEHIFSMKFLICLSLFLFSFIPAHSQADTVSGTVYEKSTNLPLIGASIVVQGTSNGVSSDFDGAFTITNVSEGSVLVISYLGYITQEIVVKDAQPITIYLESDAQSLEQVIVVGYGTQTRKEITGAVSVIGEQAIEDLKPQRIEQAIQGQVAGVQVTSGSGSPGSGLNINIRGVSTNGDNRPLILLDGSVIEDLSVVNPSDIESINILKDATAGIYGVRAANGVIIITTKNGKKESPLKFSVNAYAGYQQTTRKLPVLNATEYGLLVNEARTNGGQSPLFANVSSLGQGTDWQDEVFDTAPISNTDLTISGGGKKSRYALAASYLSQDGIVGAKKSNFERATARLRYSVDVLDNLKFDASTIYTYTKRSTIAENGIGSILFNALNNAPTFGVRDEDGAFTLSPGLGAEVINPVAQISNTFNETLVNKITGSFGLTYSFLDHFEVQSRFQANYADVDILVFNPVVDYGNEKVFTNLISTVNDDEQIFKDYTFDAFAKYKNTFAENHNVTALVGTSVFQTVGDFFSFVGINIPDNNFDNANLQAAEIVRDNFINRTNRVFDQRLLSYFTRVQYDYEGKYLFSGLLRRDGSTNFGPENQFGYFPSASVGWVALDEAFLEDSNLLDFLKVRMSYGIIGNDRIPAFQFVSLLDGEGVYVIDDELVFGEAPGAISNPEIKWEEQYTFDVGVDAKFFNNKISVTADYFNRTTEDLLVSAPVSGILGASAPGSAPPIVNAGTVENKGFEFSIAYQDDFTDDFSINTSFNFTTLKNEVLFVNNDNGFIPGGGFGIGQNPPARFEAGFPIGYFRGLQTDGLFQSQAEVAASAQPDATPGDIRFIDQNGDGIIDADGDAVSIGDPIPDVTLGFNVTINYKIFDFLTYAYASLGNDIVRNYERFQPLTNRSTRFLDRYTVPGSSNSVPRVTTGANTNTLFSDFFVEDGSFLRVQNIQLGYTFPDALASNLKMDSFRIYTAVTNAFTFTKYSGYDPTTSSGAPIGAGIDTGNYPSPRTFLLGLNLKF